MPLTLPVTVKSLGNAVLVAMTATPAAGSGIPTVAEANAAKFITCHIYDEAILFPAIQNTGDGPRKACTNVTPTQMGTVKYDAEEIQYSFAPQLLGTPGNAANTAYETLTEGTVLTLIQLLGVGGTASSVSAGQVANIYKVTVGRQTIGTTGGGEFDEFSAKSKLTLVGGVPIALNTVLA